MRILAGKYKGKTIKASDDQSIRPTTNRVKEVIFTILDDFCKGKVVADLFCGSGNLGIETLSRGAAKVCFIDNTRKSIQILSDNLKSLPLKSNCYDIIHADALHFSSNKRTPFDLILMDPPFDYPPLNILINRIFDNELLKPDGILVVEHEISNPILLIRNKFDIVKQKRYDRSLISFISNLRGNREKKAGNLSGHI